MKNEERKMKKNEKEKNKNQKKQKTKKIGGKTENGKLK